MGMSGNPLHYGLAQGERKYDHDNLSVPDLREMIDVTPKPAGYVPSEIKKLIDYNKRSEKK